MGDDGCVQEGEQRRCHRCLCVATVGLLRRLKTMGCSRAIIEGIPRTVQGWHREPATWRTTTDGKGTVRREKRSDWSGSIFGQAGSLLLTREE